MEPERPIANEEQPPAPIDAPAHTNGVRALGHRDRFARPQRSTGRVAPHNLEAEESLLGAMLLSRSAIELVLAERLEVGDFYRPAHGFIYAAAVKLHGEGRPVDPVTVSDELARSDLLDMVGGPAALVGISMRTPATSSAGHYARVVIDHSAMRQLISAGGEIAEIGYSLPDDVTTAVARATDVLDHAVQRSVAATTRWRAHELDEFLDAEEEEYDWVLDGVLERTDRVLITGGEGGGKSTLIRQVAVQAASGIHPFTLDDIEPITVLLVDLENSEKQVRRKIRPLRISAGDRYQPGRLQLHCRPEGVDLLDRGDAHDLEALIADVHPDLVVGGPVYKLVGGDPTEEQPAKAAAMLLDRLRVEHGFALILETHQPHEAGGSSKRVERPYGASLWKRWPEFGLHIGKTDERSNVAELKHWRGARDERDWPAALQRGGEWPWTVPGDKAMTFALVLQVARDFAFAYGALPSTRQIEERTAELGKRIPKSTVQRMIDNNRTAWAALEAEVG